MTSRLQRSNPRVQTLETRHRPVLVQPRAIVETVLSSKRSRWRRLHDQRDRTSTPDTKDSPATYNSRSRTKNPAPSNDSQLTSPRERQDRERRVRPRLAYTAAIVVDRSGRQRRRRAV